MELDSREKEVIAMIATGFTYKQAAYQMRMSLRQTHRILENARAKTNTFSTPHLVAFYMKYYI